MNVRERRSEHGDLRGEKDQYSDKDSVSNNNYTEESVSEAHSTLNAEIVREQESQNEFMMNSQGPSAPRKVRVSEA